MSLESQITSEISRTCQRCFRKHVDHRTFVGLQVPSIINLIRNCNLMTICKAELKWPQIKFIQPYNPKLFYTNHWDPKHQRQRLPRPSSHSGTQPVEWQSWMPHCHGKIHGKARLIWYIKSHYEILWDNERWMEIVLLVAKRSMHVLKLPINSNLATGLRSFRRPLQVASSYHLDCLIGKAKRHQRSRNTVAPSIDIAWRQNQPWAIDDSCKQRTIFLAMKFVPRHTWTSDDSTSHVFGLQPMKSVYLATISINHNSDGPCE